MQDPVHSTVIVALMDLEMFDLVHKNLKELWIGPSQYQNERCEAAGTLRDDAGMNVSIYSHRLCVLDPRLWPLARKPILDWKNIYLPKCNGCHALDRCGFFHSGTRIRSALVHP